MYTTTYKDETQAIADTPLPDLLDVVINRLRESNGIEFASMAQVDCLTAMLNGVREDIGIAFTTS